MGFSRQEYWSGLPSPPPGGLPVPGIQHWRQILYPLKPPGKPREVYSFLTVLFSFTFGPALTVYDERLVFPILYLFITRYFKLRSRLHTVKGKLFSPTLCDPMDCSPPQILKVRILDWLAVFFSKRSSRPRDQTPSLLHCCLSHQDKS